MIDPAGLLLAIVDVEDALSNRLLQDVGLDVFEIRRALLGARADHLAGHADLQKWDFRH